MYFMHTFDELNGKAIAATSSCLFEASSGRNYYRTIFHITQDHGILLFCIAKCSMNAKNETENVFASDKEIMSCVQDPDFQNTLLNLDVGIQPDEIHQCISRLMQASTNKKRKCFHHRPVASPIA